MRLRGIALGALALLLACMLAPAGRAEEITFQGISDEELLNLFLVRAVKVTDTKGLEPHATATLLKWDRPPRFRIVGEDGELAALFANNVARPVLKTFIESTSVTATVSVDDAAANVVTIIGEDPLADLDRYEPELLAALDGDQAEIDRLRTTIAAQPKLNCFYKPRVVDRIVRGAVIYVPKPGTAMYATAKCFGSMSASVLGLTGVDKDTDTVRNRTDPAVSFTTTDRMVLRILYDPRVPPQIRIEELQPIVSAIKHELSPPQ